MSALFQRRRTNDADCLACCCCCIKPKSKNDEEKWSHIHKRVRRNWFLIKINYLQIKQWTSLKIIRILEWRIADETLFVEVSGWLTTFNIVLYDSICITRCILVHIVPYISHPSPPKMQPYNWCFLIYMHCIYMYDVCICISLMMIHHCPLRRMAELPKTKKT